MKKMLLSFLLAMAVLLPAHSQLLYRISGNGLDKPSYIVGTFHLADAACIDKIPGARDAIGAVDVVCGELDMRNGALNPDSLKLLTEKMMLPEGQTLKTLLTEEQFKRVDAYFEKVMGMALSNEMVFAQMGRMVPMTLSTTLSMMGYVKRHPGEFNPQNGIDEAFQQQGIAQGKSSMGLETVAFQAEVLYGAPLDRQVEQLMCTVDNAAYTEDMTERMATYYYAQDLDKLHELMEEKLGNSCDDRPEEKEVLLYGRNDNWLQKMPALMKQHATLFVVGAGHLAGDRGVLAGLRKAGYTVEGVR